MTPLIARKLSKRYGGTIALDAVDFEVHAGAVNVLIGENGAGKSTLMRIFAGIEQPSDGMLVLDDAPVRFRSVRDAAGRGIGIVHQELNLCPNLTVAENIFLMRQSGPLIDRTRELFEARALLERIGPAIDPAVPVSSLRIGQQQIVEIARALAVDVRVLILDEPTSALSAAEVDVLFGVIAELKRKGKAIVYISHRLEELMRIGDHVTVLRDGRRVAHAPIGEVTIPWIVEKMLGKKRQVGRKPPRLSGARALLEMRRVVVPATQGGPCLTIDDLAIGAGEVTALYGLLGSGRTELLEAVAGLRAAAGTIRLNGAEISRLTLADRVKLGALLVPEDRQRDGLFPNLSVGGNISLSHLANLARRGFVSAPKETAAVKAMIDRLRVKARSPASSIMTLSGGNQQKAVIARCLMPGPAAILLDEPGRGVDIGARAEIFETIRSLAEQGIAVLFTTSDISEALEAADRIVILADGRITANMAAADADELTMVQAANNLQTSVAENI